MGWLENIVGKGENAGNQHFLLFPTMFSKGLFFWVIKSRDYVVKGLINDIGKCEFFAPKKGYNYSKNAPKKGYNYSKKKRKKVELRRTMYDLDMYIGPLLVTGNTRQPKGYEQNDDIKVLD